MPTQTIFISGDDGVYRLPPAAQRVRVVQGDAWITVNDKDIVLHAGEEATIASSANPVLVSCLGTGPLCVAI